MSPAPFVELEALRACAADVWAPAVAEGADPRAEHDRYLLQAFGRLRAGEDFADVVAFLVRIEAENMGVTRVAGGAYRAQIVARKLADYAAQWPPGPVRVRVE